LYQAPGVSTHLGIYTIEEQKIIVKMIPLSAVLGLLANCFAHGDRDRWVEDAFGC